MHKDNPHHDKYDLKVLAKSHPVLKNYIIENEFTGGTIPFGNPLAVKALNTAILKHYYNVEYWGFPNEHLCPPIPSRVDYLYELKGVLDANGLTKDIKVLDIGTGANCVYPLLGLKAFKWNFIASDSDADAIKSAKNIIDKNNFNTEISFKQQTNERHILRNVITEDDFITASVCNPPFYKNEEEAIRVTNKKWKGLKMDSNSEKNFSGKPNELWYNGGEIAFIKNYIYDSQLFKKNCAWFTTLVSNKDHLRPLKVHLKPYNPTQVKVIKMTIGNKVSHMLLWSFLSEDEFKTFKTN